MFQLVSLGLESHAIRLTIDGQTVLSLAHEQEFDDGNIKAPSLTHAFVGYLLNQEIIIRRYPIRRIGWCSLNKENMK